jgi:hypothetical protein
MAAGQGATCRNAGLYAGASSHAWIDQAFIPTRAKRFALIVIVPAFTRPATTVDVGWRGQWWRARVSKERSGGKDRTIRLRTQDDAPEWLKMADSVQVCLLLNEGTTRRLVRLPTVAVRTTS